MNIYDARWNNAKKQALKINKYIEKGYLCICFDINEEAWELIHTSLKIEECNVIDCQEDGIYFQEGNAKYYIYDRYPDIYEHSVKETNERFKSFKFYKPVKVR